MLSEVAKYLTDVPYMLFFRVGIDEDIVWVYQHAYIEQVTEDVIHKMLKSGRCIRKSEGHDTPFEGAIVGVESVFPFIALLNMDQVLCVTEVNSCVESCLSWAVEEVRDAG